jgi:N utilization substance protein B
MKDKVKKVNPNSIAREFAVQFLYQCEREKIKFFPEENFRNFAQYFNIDREALFYTRKLLEGTFDKMLTIDEKIAAVAKNWSIHRMSATDRCVLRLAAYELLASEVPRKVAINEAINLAKRYGTENSGSFVNGILDKLAAEETKH